MAKKHYVIEAKGAEKIDNNTITIENCCYIEKNHRILDKNGNYKKISKENLSISDWISIVLTGVAVICIVIMLACLALLKDGSFLEGVHIDNIISEIGLIFAVVSIKQVKKFIERILIGPRILKKLMLCIFVMLAPFYIVVLFNLLGFSQSMSNCISVIAIVLAILSY